MPKLKHIEKDSLYSHETQRREVFAWCGYSEECSGSGKHGLKGDPDSPDCTECSRIEKEYYSSETYEQFVDEGSYYPDYKE